MRSSRSKLLSELIAKLSPLVIENRNNSGAFSNRKSRRDFLRKGIKGALAVGVMGTVPNVLSSCKANSSAKKELVVNGNLKIAIIGGGIAGLNCAYHLQKAGLDFQVFEASKRLGGRILTHYNDSMGVGIFPEFGGDFIDTNHEDMLNLVKEFNLELIDIEEECKKNKLHKETFYFDNRLISEKEVIQEFNKIAPKIASDIDSLGENYDTQAAIDFDNMPLCDYFESLECSVWLKELLDAAYIAEFGLDCSEQSTLNFLDMIGVETANGFKVFGESDERFRIKGGNSKIIENLAAKIGDERIKTNYILNEITDAPEGGYYIYFENGEVYKSDKLVITIPFTKLREVTLNLKDLSPEKKKCIDELGYGTNTKLGLPFENEPWKNKPNNAMGYLYHKEISNGWESSYNKAEGNNYGVYMCFFGGKYSEELNKVSTKNKFAPPTHLWRTELPEEKVNHLVNELDKVFKGVKENFRGRHVFVNWIDYPFAKGSYSCYKVGQWSTIAGLEGEPVGEIYFAGEHCSIEFMGFMNGGAESGRLTAENLIKAHKNA